MIDNIIIYIFSIDFYHHYLSIGIIFEFLGKRHCTKKEINFCIVNYSKTPLRKIENCLLMFFNGEFTWEIFE
jgi:hypothetical protein